jgi:hypothetical protein
MGKFYTTTTWIEDDEYDLLSKYDFYEEIWETEFLGNEINIARNLESKGFIHSTLFEGRKFYQGTSGYLQHFHNR